MGNEAVQVLKLALISFRAFRNFFCSDSRFEPIIDSWFIGLEFMSTYSQLQFVEELEIDLLAILRKSLDRAVSLYIFIREVRLSGARVSIIIFRIRELYKM